jgi:membrane dipeptidase
LRNIAATGGVIGIGFWDVAVCRKDARAIRYAMHVGGVDHIASLQA